MYKILGSDGNEYGPASAEQVRKWIAETLVERKTPAIPEGEEHWVFPGSLPEFAAAFTRKLRLFRAVCSVLEIWR